MRKYMLARYHKRRAEAIRKLGGKCVKCGSEENLEIDHIDPTTKSFEISKLWNVSKEVFDAEPSVSCYAVNITLRRLLLTRELKM